MQAWRDGWLHKLHEYYNFYYFPQCDLVTDNGRSKINIKSMNINTKATIGHHEHVHHHHHRHHKDDVESFKQQSLRVRKRRKMISQVLFVTLSILAAIIIIACVASNWLF